MYHQAEQSLAFLKKAGATQAECFIAKNEQKNLTIRLGNKEEDESSTAQTMTLRARIGHKQAMLSTTNLDTENIKLQSMRVVEMAQSSPEDPHSRLASSEELAKEIKSLDLFDDADPSHEQLSHAAQSCEDTALSHKEITNSEGASCGFSKSHITLATSEGFLQHYQSSYFSTSISVIAGEGTHMQRDYAYSSKRFYDELNTPKAIGEEAAQNTLRRLDAKKGKAGTYPVVLDKRISKSLLGYFLGAINGASIAKGTSFLKDQMGKPIWHKDIAISQNPHQIRGLASKPFDAEGLETKPLTLVEHGILQHWLLDLRSAKQLGLTSNGCASRSTGSLPSPAANNAIIENGTATKEELLADIKEGIYVTEHFGTGVNLVTGDFSQGISGFWIENGKLTYPVQEMTMASNLSHIFKHCIAANDLEYKNAINAPTLRVDGMVIA